MYKKTPAICLKKTNYTQKDSLVTLFTAKFGKDVFLARGLRKPKAKLKSALFPLRGVNLTFVEGRQFPVITGAELKIEPEALEENFNFHSLALFWAEIVDLAFVEPEPDPDFFNIFLQSLQSLNREAEKNKQITTKARWINVWLIIKLLIASGYEFQLNHCIACNNKISGAHKHKFSLNKGGVMCKKCSDNKGNLISEKAREALLQLKKNNSLQFSFPPREVLKEVQSISLSFLYHQLKKQPTTHALLDW